MMFKFIWLCLIAFNSVNSVRFLEINKDLPKEFNNDNLFKNLKKDNSLPKYSIKINPSSNQLSSANKEDNPVEKKNAIVYLDDIAISPIQKKEISRIKCIGDLCDSFKSARNEKDDAFNFQPEKLSDKLDANYKIICENIENQSERDCYIQVELNKKDKSGDKKSGEDDLNKKTKDKEQTNHWPFIFTFLGVQTLIALVLFIVFGLNGRGPLKTFLKPDRS